MHHCKYWSGFQIEDDGRGAGSLSAHDREFAANRSREERQRASSIIASYAALYYCNSASISQRFLIDAGWG